MTKDKHTGELIAAVRYNSNLYPIWCHDLVHTTRSSRRGTYNVLAVNYRTCVVKLEKYHEGHSEHEIFYEWLSMVRLAGGVSNFTRSIRAKRVSGLPGRARAAWLVYNNTY